MLLAWGLYNGMETVEPNVEGRVIWRQLNHLAGIIKELDPHHPVMTVISEAKSGKIDGILQYNPNIDVLGVNSHSNKSNVGQDLIDVGWKGP